MSAKVPSIFTSILQKLWQGAKNLVNMENVETADLPFKIATKETSTLMLLLIFTNIGNQFFRNIDIDCTPDPTAQNSGRGGLEWFPGIIDTNLTNNCWYNVTFLVVKALQPDMRGRVLFPGILNYTRGVDEVVPINYYNKIWIGLGTAGLVSFLPMFLWKLKGIGRKFKSLIKVDPEESCQDETDARRVSQFLELLGSNNGIALYYFVCKFMALLTPIFSFVYLTHFLGPQFKFYGVEVLLSFIGSRSWWPDPKDVLFPKMSKCEWTLDNGAIREAMCQLPMNQVSQWTFFMVWWWIMFALILNIVYFLDYILFVFPSCRNYVLGRYVASACLDDTGTQQPLEPRGRKANKPKSINEFISFSIKYGDWFLLQFLQRNLVDAQFKSFIQKLATSGNPVLQLKSQEQNDVSDSESDNQPCSLETGRVLEGSHA